MPGAEQETLMETYDALRAFLADLADRGIELDLANGDKLRVRGWARLSDPERDRLRERRDELVALLSPDVAPVPVEPGLGSGGMFGRVPGGRDRRALVRGRSTPPGTAACPSRRPPREVGGPPRRRPGDPPGADESRGAVRPRRRGTARAETRPSPSRRRPASPACC